MRALKPLIFTLLVAVLLAAQAPHGITARPDAARYAAHAEQDGILIGASRLTRKEVTKAFPAEDLNQGFLLVEVAFYPQKGKFVKITQDKFVLREAGKDIGVNALPPDVVAARVKVKSPPSPPPDDEHKAGVSGSSEIVYRRDHVPNSQGQMTTRTSIRERERISVGIPIGPKPESPEAAESGTRRAMEADLRDKMLPETSAWEPVAGYLYFSAAKKPKSGYELVYILNEKKIVLPLK